MQPSYVSSTEGYILYVTYSLLLKTSFNVSVLTCCDKSRAGEQVLPINESSLWPRRGFVLSALELLNLLRNDDS